MIICVYIGGFSRMDCINCYALFPLGVFGINIMEMKFGGKYIL